MDNLKFLTKDQVRDVVSQFGSPVYFYDEKLLKKSASQVLTFPNAYGLTARYSMKASSNAVILNIFDKMGLHFDASSGFEAERALKIGINPDKIQITAQELPLNLKELVEKKVLFVACSLNQIEAFGKLFPGLSLGIRINPGLGSGHSRQTNVGGPSASFGIWWEHIELIKDLLNKYNLTVDKLHTHIGSGSDPIVWQNVATMSLETLKQFENVTTLNLGGGFKIGRMKDEVSTDMNKCGRYVLESFEKFYYETNRKIKLEIEPGTFLTALSGALITKIMDKVSTGKDGYTFLKLNSGMTEIMRPALYNARHPLIVVSQDKQNDLNEDTEDVIVVGHCCESGDILSPINAETDNIETICLKKAEINDLLVIDATGSYCSSMTCANYNSFPRAAEILLKEEGSFTLIRKRQTIAQMIENEKFN